MERRLRSLFCARALHVGLGALAVTTASLGAQGTTTTSVAGSPILEDPSDRTVLLADGTAAAGLSGIFNTGNTHTGGSAWLDYNNDLLPDLFITGGSGQPHYLFRNDGGGVFTDVTSIIPKSDLLLEESGVKFADIDNDGDDDIFVGMDNPSTLVPPQPVNPPEGGPNHLYINNGDGTFTETAAAAGVLNPNGRRTSCAGFADYDNDGFVDLYTGGWTMYELPLGVHSDGGFLFKNDGDGTFTDVTTTFGVDDYGLDSLVVLWFDINFDRYPDLYVGNVAHTNTPPLFVPIDAFYMNSGGTSFTDQVPTLSFLGNDAYANMGMDVGDIDNDGDWDLYITDIFNDPPVPQGNVLYRTTDSFNGVMSDNAAAIGNVSADSSWPCNFVDFNHDGFVDLWVTGIKDDDVSYVFMNDGTGKFDVVTPFLLQTLPTRGGSSADYDGDGDVDFVLTMYEDDMMLVRNDTFGKGNWLQFKLYGTTTNAGAIGALVKVTANGVTQMRRVTGGDSAHSQSEAILHFGIGDATDVVVDVEWPSGTDQSFPSVAANGLVLIDEDAGILAPSLVDDGSGWSDRGRVLDVRLKSNYGGRISLDVEGLGALRFDAATGAHVGSFELAPDQARPRSLTVRSERGDSFQVAAPQPQGGRRAEQR